MNTNGPGELVIARDVMKHHDNILKFYLNFISPELLYLARSMLNIFFDGTLILCDVDQSTVSV